MIHLRALLLAVTALCLSAAAPAQQPFPSHPLKIVVPFGAGTGLDVMARGYAERSHRAAESAGAG